MKTSRVFVSSPVHSINTQLISDSHHLSLPTPESQDYKMIQNYLEKTYEPVRIEDVVSAIVCSDASSEAPRYGFTVVDRPEGFLILVVASLGDEITEVSSPPEDTKVLEEKKAGVKGLGRKQTDEAEHFSWKDDIKVPCGRLVPSEHKDSPLESNEYASYDPKQIKRNQEGELVRLIRRFVIN